MRLVLGGRWSVGRCTVAGLEGGSSGVLEGNLSYGRAAGIQWGPVLFALICGYLRPFALRSWDRKICAHLRKSAAICVEIQTGEGRERNANTRKYPQICANLRKSAQMRFHADERRIASLPQIPADEMMKNLNANEEGMDRESPRIPSPAFASFVKFVVQREPSPDSPHPLPRRNAIPPYATP